MKKPKTVEFCQPLDDQTSGEPTPIMAIDCEYVGGGPDGKMNMLARVSIVNEDGAIVYDEYVKPTSKVTDYRTHVSGIRPHHLRSAIPFHTTRTEVWDLLRDRTIVGHSVYHDFKALNPSPSRKQRRDTSECSILNQMVKFKGRHPSLKMLAKNVLGIDIQTGEHDSVIDAR